MSPAPIVDCIQHVVEYRASCTCSPGARIEFIGRRDAKPPQYTLAGALEAAYEWVNAHTCAPDRPDGSER